MNWNKKKPIVNLNCWHCYFVSSVSSWKKTPCSIRCWYFSTSAFSELYLLSLWQISVFDPNADSNIPLFCFFTAHLLCKAAFPLSQWFRFCDFFYFADVLPPNATKETLKCLCCLHDSCKDKNWERDVFRWKQQKDLIKFGDKASKDGKRGTCE